MRVIVLGGTWFVGRVVVEALAASGHDVLIVHRGLSEPTGLPGVRHLHADREEWPASRAVLAAFGVDAAVDVSAGNAAGAAAALGPCRRVSAWSRCPIAMSTARTRRSTAAGRPTRCR
jgi:nucleoside-diphosphate-sugar epimerase